MRTTRMRMSVHPVALVRRVRATGLRHRAVVVQSPKMTTRMRSRTRKMKRTSRQLALHGQRVDAHPRLAAVVRRSPRKMKTTKT
jgi:hypothetical protein